jgi:glycosyltransferase involved in cell wall biosynthesis
MNEGNRLETMGRAERVAGSPRIIVDMTDLIGQLAPGHRPAGIHRVVLEFANAAALVARERGLPLVCGCFDEASGKYLQFAPSFCDTAPGSRPFDWIAENTLFQRGHPRPINLNKLTGKYADRPLKRRLHLAYAGLRLIRRRMALRLVASFKPPIHAEALQFRPGDRLLMLGSGWDALPVYDHIEPLAKAGLVTPLILVHDLIPLVELRSSGILSSGVFRAWLGRAARLAAGLLTYSASTRNDLIDYLSRTGQRTPPVSVATLPHEFTPPAETPLSKPVQGILPANYALFVGPVSGRKNASRLLEAWAKVIGRLGPDRTPLLVITDRRGAAQVHDTHIRPIASHVRLLDRPSDYELSRLYSAAAFTVFPSLYEGWGLPVGESLWHGIPCITSNASSLPEVGGPLCDYVDPTSVDSIASAVERFAADRGYRDRRAKAIRREDLRLWRDFANDVIEAALSHSDPPSVHAEAEAPPAFPFVKPDEQRESAASKY